MKKIIIFWALLNILPLNIIYSETKDSSYINLIYGMELKIAKLEQARDDYSNNIQFFSLVITIVVAVATTIIGFNFYWRYKSTLKKLHVKITDFKREYENFTNDYKGFKSSYEIDQIELYKSAAYLHDLISFLFVKFEDDYYEGFRKSLDSAIFHIKSIKPREDLDYWNNVRFAQMMTVLDKVMSILREIIKRNNNGEIDRIKKWKDEIFYQLNNEFKRVKNKDTVDLIEEIKQYINDIITKDST